ncbi:DUF4188 domain-containing protein [Phycicoccus endophyticus]|uniref:DUF4188 domain-containing protein n=1 Tax=Phycicoccus endophyticus TaxID=1690220 RepID=A0A7G9QYC4_9MICO|nr:DUF4188 domain-containing protein [Phycicoccus endophyticus]NHI19242.1 DUF4188 domain-containing protein [Phycicoccus endophyticus]QNN48349.1 DUF4188 domain-containing protein [Phycicoccus endophyticus]GGL41261.1 hypothetical protein GCM10012283_24770 [Phycicoccus endophyticus]
MDRVTHAYDGPLTVFLIGLRVHRPWHLRLVRQAGGAMTRMLTELERNRAAAGRGQAEHLGYLGSRTTVHLMGATTIQWWRSTEELYAYAASGEHAHRPAWTEFYRLAARSPGAVTIWHETYEVSTRGPESVYVGPKPFGLAAVAGSVPVRRRGESARERLGSRLS